MSEERFIITSSNFNQCANTVGRHINENHGTGSFDTYTLAGAMALPRFDDDDGSPATGRSTRQQVRWSITRSMAKNDLASGTWPAVVSWPCPRTEAEPFHR